MADFYFEKKKKRIDTVSEKLDKGVEMPSIHGMMRWVMPVIIALVWVWIVTQLSSTYFGRLMHGIVPSLAGAGSFLTFVFWCGIFLLTWLFWWIFLFAIGLVIVKAVKLVRFAYLLVRFASLWYEEFIFGEEIL